MDPMDPDQCRQVGRIKGHRRRGTHHREAGRQGRPGVQEEIAIPLPAGAKGVTTPAAPVDSPAPLDTSMRSPPGVLLVQLGTPDAPTVPALRRYLRQFLGDPRVIEAPRLLWWLILNLRILPTRPAQSAAKYQRIWDPKTGSPLLHITRLQTEALQQALPRLPV